MAAGPIYLQQALTWIWTLRDLAVVAPQRIVVHVLDTVPPFARRRIDDLGVETIAISPFAPGYPHCNKLRQLEGGRFTGDGTTVFCDTDVAFVDNVDDLATTAAIRAKVVDLPNPPLEIWRGVLAAAGLTGSPPLTTTSVGRQTTLRTNCNGGVVMVPGWAVAALSESWPRWARWLMNRPSLLPDGFTIHIDQIAFALALLEGGHPFDDLALGANYPTHLDAETLETVTPRVLHYHDRVDPSGFLSPTGRPEVDRAIARVNDVVAKRRRDGFHNRSFWDFRYRHAPDLGSGLGSRGDSLEYKRQVLSTLVGPTDSVLDVGCGDLELWRDVAVTAYAGVDVSEEALAIARSKRPNGIFHHGELHDLALSAADVVVSFDVLIHQPTMAGYRGLLSGLAGLAKRRLIVSGYEEPPRLSSEITFFHEPLSVSLARLAGEVRVRIAGTYRDTTVAVVDLPADDPHALTARLATSERFDTPFGRFSAVRHDLIATQFVEFGGHTRNELAMVLSLLRPGDTVVDVGAHIGSFAVPMARRVGSRGRVLAVEADPLNVELLYQNVAGNEVADVVIVTEAIVGSSEDTYLVAVDEANTGATYFQAVAGPPARPALTVDDIVARHADPAVVRLLKVDVEGMELAVLQSAEQVLGAARPIIYCEVSAAQLARAGSTVDDLQTFFDQRGYALFRNRGERNSTHDRFEIEPLDRLVDGGAFFDCLAVPAERSDEVQRG